MLAIKHAQTRFSFLLMIVVFLVPALPVQADTITVDSTCTLAQAITSANDDTTATDSSCEAGSGDDKIIFAVTRNLTQALPAITSNITIEGGGSLSADGVPYFNVTAGSLTVNGIELEGAFAYGANVHGAGINCHTSCTGVTVTNSVLDNNATNNHGGAIRVVGSADLTVTNTLFTDNAAVKGGGIYFGSSGTLNISGSTFRQNIADTGDPTLNDGGGIYIASSGSGSLIANLGFVSNGADNNGGPIYVASGASVTVRNSTFGANVAILDGGAIYSAGTITLQHVTMADNRASVDDNDATSGTTGLHNAGGTVTLVNSILAGGAGGNTCKGPIGIKVANIIDGGGCGAADTVKRDPSLGTRTTRPPIHYPLNSDSGAIGVGDSNYCLGTDQLGNSRDSTGCDLGAIEYEGTPTTIQPTVEPTVEPAVEPTPEPTTGPGPGPDPAPEETPAPQRNSGSSSGGQSASSPQSSSSSEMAAGTTSSTCAILMQETDITVTDLSGVGVGYQCQRADATAVGDVRVIAMGLVDAVDVWGWIALGIELCFPQSGAAVFLDAAHAPRTLHSLVSYRNDNGMTCVEIDRAGTVALVEGSPTYDYDPSNQLSNCMVFTKNILNFRKSPGGEIKGLIPALVTLTALGRAPGWYEVDYWGEVGWISADYVEPQGDCGG